MNNYLPLGNINKWLEQDPFQEMLYIRIAKRKYDRGEKLCHTAYVLLGTFK